MATITLHGNKMRTSGELPAKGTRALSFILTDKDMADRALSTFAGKKVVLNIFPSIDTSVCAMSVRRFNSEASGMEETAVLCISADLPFAHKRFCGAEGLDAVVTFSTFRDRNFGRDYGVEIIEGPMKGLMSRAVVIITRDGKVAYTEQVPEIAQEPDYEAALSALRSIG